MTAKEILLKHLNGGHKTFIFSNSVAAMEEYASTRTRELESENKRLQSKLSEIKEILESNNFDDNIVGACIKALEGLSE